MKRERKRGRKRMVTQEGHAEGDGVPKGDEGAGVQWEMRTEKKGERT